ncbi:MAG: TetR/AcrR family transcriptional regulator [Lachnospiraceae bacterium]
MGNGMKAENKFDIKKEELFHQITELISQYGFENITIRGLCTKMGISTGTFYHYFHDKGDLIKVLFDDIDEYFAVTVPKDFTDSEPDNLMVFFLHYGKYVVRNGVETCRCISVSPLTSRINNYMGEGRGISTTLLGIMKRGVEKKQFKSSVDPEDMTRMLLILMRGYSADWAKHDGSYDIIKEMEKFGEFVRGPLLP